jgi:hypothetical protein
MIDDIRIVVDVNHTKEQDSELLPGGEYRKPRRLKFLGKRERSVRVRSIRGGTKLVIEGSFAGYLQGHNIVGTMDLQRLVTLVVIDVLKRMNLKPTHMELKKINDGNIKLERIDVVGFIRCDELEGPSTVINQLELGLSGAPMKRFIAPGETLTCNVTSSYWSLTFYNKARQMESKFPEMWASLDSLVKDIGTRFIRIELRQLLKELQRQNIILVKDATPQWLEKTFSERLKEVFSNLNCSTPDFPINSGSVDKYELLARLYVEGKDLISTLLPTTQRRVWKNIESRFGIKRGQLNVRLRRYHMYSQIKLGHPWFFSKDTGDGEATRGRILARAS